MEDFLLKLPKIELHAHLNGSLSVETIRYLAKVKSSNVNGGNFEQLLQITDDETRTLDECFHMFRLIHEVTDRPELIRLATKAVIKEFAEENTKYLELRSTPRSNHYMNMKEYVEAIISGINESAAESIPIVVKLLVSIDRSKGVEIAEKITDLAIELHQTMPDVVVGMDMSGNMKGSKARDFFPLLERARAAGLRIAIHAAEIHDDEETEDVLHFHPDRIGHGTYIPPLKCKNERLFALLKQKKIPLEVCLTSNLKGGTVESYADHHIGVLIQEKLPFVICTDDKGVFSTSLTKEYGIVAKTFELTNEEMWQVSYNAIEHIFDNGALKSGLMKEWKTWRSSNDHFFQN